MVNKAQIDFRQLNGLTELSRARALLYRVCCLEQNWQFGRDNPIGIRIERRGDAVCLSDDFDAASTWFAAFKDQEMIGCLRIHGPVDGKHELEHYTELPLFLRYRRSLQISRLVIEKKHRRNSLAVFGLVREMVGYVYGRGYEDLFTASTFPNPGAMYLKLCMKKHSERGFKYSDSDAENVFLFVADRLGMERSIDYCSRILLRFGPKPIRKENACG